MNRSRWIIVALALAAAIAFAVSVQVGRWWSIDDCSIGPFGSRDCIAGMSSTNSWLGGSQTWMRSGMATWAGGLIAMLALLAVAASTAAGRLSRLAARTTLVAIATASFAAAAFVARFPGVTGAQIDRGIVLFVIGDVLAVIAALQVLRAVKRAT